VIIFQYTLAIIDTLSNTFVAAVVLHFEEINLLTTALTCAYYFIYCIMFGLIRRLSASSAATCFASFQTKTALFPLGTKNDASRTQIER
jgi:hypothetical protein